MDKRRRRFKQTTTLAERLSAFSDKLRQRRTTLEPSCEEAIELRKRIWKSEAALEINASLTRDK